MISDKILHLLFIMLTVSSWVVSIGCYDHPPVEEKHPKYLEIEYFYGSESIQYIKISKNNDDISIDYFSVFCLQIDPLSNDTATRVRGLLLTAKEAMITPIYKQGKIPATEFNKFWQLFHKLNLSALNNRINNPGNVGRDPYFEGAFRIKYTLNGKRVDKTIYITDQMNEEEIEGGWVMQSPPPVITLTELVLKTKNFLTDEIRGVKTIGIIKVKLLELYKHKGNFAIDGTAGYLWEGAIKNALILLGEKINSSSPDEYRKTHPWPQEEKPK